jgi:hypothetical protein
VLSEALADFEKSNVKYFIHVPCPGTPNEDNTWSYVIGSMRSYTSACLRVLSKLALRHYHAV